jgi:hypothetical protein
MEEFCSSFASESFNFFHKKTDIEKSEEFLLLTEMH